MSGEYIRLRFNLDKPIIFERGAYVRNEWGWFILQQDYKPRYDRSTGGFTYELQLDAWYYFLNGRVLTFRPKFGATETSFTLTGDILKHWEVILENLRYNNLNIYSGTPSMTYRQFEAQYVGADVNHAYAEMLEKDGCVEVGIAVHYVNGEDKDSLVENVAKGISYESVKIADAFGLLCGEDKFNCEWWVEGNLIHFGRLGCDKTKEALDWEIGVQCEDMQRSDSNEEAATRIIAFGSTRNVPARYRKNLIFTVTDPASDYVDTFRQMKAEWFAKDTRTTVPVSYNETCSYTLHEPQKVSIDFDILDLPKFSISDAKVSVYLPPRTYNDRLGVLYEYNDKIRNKFLLGCKVHVVSVDENNVIVTTEEITGCTYRSIEDIIAQNGQTVYYGYEISIPNYSGIVSSSAAKLYLYITAPERIAGEEITTTRPDTSIIPAEFNELDRTAFIKSYSGTYTKDNYFKVDTTAQILTGEKAGETLNIIINGDVRNVKSFESGKIEGLSGLNVGDTYTLDNVLSGKVPVKYFTDERTSMISNYERRLMLPEDKYPNNYIDSELLKGEDGEIDESKIVEVVKVYEEVYPTQELSVSHVETFETKEQDPDDPDNPEPVSVTHYRLFIPSSDFDFDDTFLTEDKLECQFQTGDLAGMTFEVSFGKGFGGDAYKDMPSYELVINDTYGIDLPNEVLKPKEGDKVVFFGYDPSQLETGEGNMVLSAELKLEEEVKKTLRKIELDTSRYTCPLMSDYAKGLYDNDSMPQMGDPINVVNYGIFKTYRSSRVIGMDINLDIPYDTPKYIVGDDEEYSRSAETAKSIASINSKLANGYGSIAGNGGSINEAQLREGIAKYGKEQFLSKKNDDTANGNITFKKNINLGTFNKGISGGRFDNNGDGELRRLTLREELTVPKLNYNRVVYTNGGTWRAQGGGTIETVTPDTDKDGNILPYGTITLHLEEGEYGALQIYDKCIGMFHFLEGENATQDRDERNGNMSMRGFTTVYFMIIEALAADGRNDTFRYVLRSEEERKRVEGEVSTDVFGSMDGRNVYDGDAHPQPQMDFAAYANHSDASRQFCSFENNTYLVMLAGMTDWIYGSNNIQYVQGYLDGFTILVYETDEWGNRITDEDGNYITREYELSGYGIGTCNIYKWGNEVTLERPTTMISQNLYYMQTIDNPDIVLKKEVVDGVEHKAWQDEKYIWSADPLSPTKDTPYVYGYWVKTYLSGGETKVEQTDAFLFSTYGEVESSLTLRWSNPIIPVRMMTSGWIEDDIPADPMMVEDVQHVSVTATLISGANEEKDIYDITSLTAATPFVKNFFAVKIADSKSWLVTFDIEGFVATQSVDIPVRVKIDNDEEIYIGHCVTLSPVFDGGDGYNGEDGTDGEDAMAYEIDSNVANVVYDSEKGEYSTETISFSFYRTIGSKNRQSFPCHYTFEYLDANGRLIGETESTDRVTTFSVNLADGYDDAHYFTARMIVNNVVVKVLTLQRVDSNTPGAPGPKGDDGEDAIGFSIEATSDVIHTNSAGIATSSFGATLYRSIGMDRAPYASTKWRIKRILEDSVIGENEYSQVSSFTINASTIGQVSSIEVSAYDMLSENALILTRTYYAVADGAQGLQGVVVRSRGEWNISEQYFNQSNSTSDDLRFVDVVIGRDKKFYMCKVERPGHPNIGKDPTIPFYDNGETSSDYWTQADQFNFIATNLLLAKDAHIEFLSGQGIYLKRGEDVTLGLQGAATDNIPMIFAGASNSEASKAPYRVYPTGDVIAESFATGESGPRMKVEDGLFNIFGRNSDMNANIKFGIDENGSAILAFYDDRGVLKYDLGSTYGLRRIADMYQEAYFVAEEYDFYNGNTNSYNAIDIIEGSIKTHRTVYKFVAGIQMNQFTNENAAKCNGLYYESQDLVTSGLDRYNYYPTSSNKVISGIAYAQSDPIYQGTVGDLYKKYKKDKLTKEDIKNAFGFGVYECWSNQPDVSLYPNGTYRLYTIMVYEFENGKRTNERIVCATQR